MDSITDALLGNKKISQDVSRYFCLVENGIKSIQDKCDQVNRNAIVLQANFIFDYYIQRNVEKKDIYTPPIRIVKGIATWNKYKDMLKKLEDNNVNFGIIITKVPNLSNKRITELLSEVNKFYTDKIPIAEVDKIANIIRKEEYGILYDILSKGGNYQKKQRKINGAIRGKIAELFLSYFVKDAISEFYDKSQVEIKENLMIDKNKIKYKDTPTQKIGLEVEIDVLVAYHIKQNLKGILNVLNNTEYADVYRNPKAPLLQVK